MSTKMKLELLPNEIFIECFQYLNAPDIFYSFDRLNYRFHTLIRNSPLHLNFQQLKKPSFNEFCQIILSNPGIKQNIISIQLSNEGTRGQIQKFLSLFLLNEFIHLRSLLLIKINDDNAEQVLPMLPFLSDLYYLTWSKGGFMDIIPALFNSKIRILTVAHWSFDSAAIYEIKSITSLIISSCDIPYACLLLKKMPMLKFLNIEYLCYYDDDYDIEDFEKLNFDTNAVHLKKFIVDRSKIDFTILERLLQFLPNLEIFSICSRDAFQMIDAYRWELLIRSSLPHLRVFNFSFSYTSDDAYNEMLIKLPPFQRDFWLKQHQWYINYEIDNEESVLVYTIPYKWNEYKLTSSMKRYCSSSMCYLNEFDNVKNLTLCTSAIRKDTPCFFRNVQSLSLTSDYESDEYKLKTTRIEYLNMIVNISNIKDLKIANECLMESSLLLKILKVIPNLSCLKISKDGLISYLKSRKLSEYLKTKITTLDISSTWNWKVSYFESNEVDLLCQTFLNLEQLHCDIKNLDDLLLILTKCSKLSVIKLGNISRQIYSWIEINASIINVYIDFERIVEQFDDDT